MQRSFIISFIALVCILAVGQPVARADGNETLGPPGIAIAPGNGIVAAGVGLSGAGGTGTIVVTVPAEATVKQVLLYWQGMAPIPGGTVDTDFQINGTVSITDGTAISDPVFFNEEGSPKANQYSYVYRKDITALGLVVPGVNNLTITGLDGFTHADDGIGVLVIYQLGSSTSTIGIRDGNDVAFVNWDGLRKGTVAQTFTFPSALTDRTATLVSFFAGIAGEVSAGGATRPTSIEVTVNGVTTKHSNELGSVDGEEWDTWTKQILIPAGVTQLTVQAFSRDDNASAEGSTISALTPSRQFVSITPKLTTAIAVVDPKDAPEGDLPASFFWLAAGLSVPDPPPPPPPPGDDGCTPGYWRQTQHFGNWPAPYTPQTLFSAVFDDGFPGKTLLDVLWLGGGGLDALGRHTVAALLNAASGDVDFAFNTASVIEQFNNVYPSGNKSDYTSLKNMWEEANESDCPLGRAELPGSGESSLNQEGPVGNTLRNYPNPFNPSTRIEFAMPLAGPVTLTIYNITGQQVRVLMSGDAAAGVHTVVWDARDDSGSPVPSGLYLYRLITAGGVEVQKMQLVR